MATKSSVIDIGVNGITEIEKATKSTASFKKELAEAKKAALEIGDPASIKRLAELQDKLEDVNDAAKTLKGSGVEGLTSSFGLLKDGIGNFDGGKISSAFKGIGAAMKAIPIFLIIEGIKLLIDNFDELVKFFGIGVTESDKLTNALNEQKKANEGLSNTISNQIKLLTAQGGNEEKILELKKKLIAIKIKEAEADIEIQKQKIKEILLNDSLVESLKKTEAQRQRLLGNNIAADLIEKGIEIDKQKRIKEASDQLRADFQAVQNLRTEDQVNEIKVQKDKQKDYKKHLEELSNIKRQNAEDQKAIDVNNAKIQQQNEDELEKQLIGKKVSDKEIELGQLNGIEDIYRQLNLEAERKYTDEQKALFQSRFNNSVAIASQTNKALQGLSDALFANQLQGVKKGSAEELKIKKKQFEVNKALSITQAIIDGIQGAQSQLKAGPIIGPILAGLVGVTAALNVKRIASQKFDGGDSGAGGDSGGGSVSLPSPNTNVPNLSSNNQPTTTFTGNQNNNFPNQPTLTKVFVTDVDLRASRDRNDRLIDQSKF